MAPPKPRTGSNSSGKNAGNSGASKSGGSARAGNAANNGLSGSGSVSGRQQTISSLINRYDNRPAINKQAPGKRSRQMSSPELDAPLGDPSDPQAGSRDSPVDLQPAGGGPARPLGQVSGGADASVNAELAELIRSVVRSELSLATTTLQRSLREAIDVLGERIAELEGRLFEKDEEIERLSRELLDSRNTTEELMDAVDHLETEVRQSTLILSGPAVPAPQRRESGESYTPEDAASVAVAVIKRSMPSVTVNRSDVASCFRVGGLRKLVCRFVCSGPESVRDEVYRGRFQLMSQRDEAQRLFVAESLSRRRQQCLSVLLSAKKRQQLYTAFTKNGVVFYKERKDGANIRVDHPGQISRYA